MYIHININWKVAGDADWGSELNKLYSISGSFCKLIGGLISRQSKKQRFITTLSGILHIVRKNYGLGLNELNPKCVK